MREQITALAQQGAPSVSRLVAVDGPVEFQTQRLSSEVHGAQRSLAFATVPDALALTCWLHREALIERLDAEIDAEADDKAALTHDQRQQQEAQLLRDVLAVERDEATLVFQAQSQGLPVEHRADIDPVALLGVALVPAQRSDLPPRTTMGLAWDLVRGR
jgi:hypothetical protein